MPQPGRAPCQDTCRGHERCWTCQCRLARPVPDGRAPEDDRRAPGGSWTTTAHGYAQHPLRSSGLPSYETGTPQARGNPATALAWSAVANPRSSQRGCYFPNATAYSTPAGGPSTGGEGDPLLARRGVDRIAKLSDDHEVADRLLVRHVVSRRHCGTIRVTELYELGGGATDEDDEVEGTVRPGAKRHLDAPPDRM